jgi:hypothetical protein
MSEVTDAYRDACLRQATAYETVIHVCQHVVLLADVLRKAPQTVQIVGVPQALGIARAEVDFNGAEWPTATAINNALADFHAAVSAVRVAWTNVRVRGEEHGLAAPPADPWEAMRKETLSRASRPPR